MIDEREVHKQNLSAARTLIARSGRSLPILDKTRL